MPLPYSVNGTINPNLFWEGNGQNDLVFRFLPFGYGPDAGKLDLRQGLGQIADEGTDIGLSGLPGLLLQKALDVLLRPGYIHVQLLDRADHLQLLGFSRQSQQSPGVTLRKTCLPHSASDLASLGHLVLCGAPGRRL